MAILRIIFICQAVDENDPVLATEVRRIRALATRPQIRKIDVIALRSGKFTLPNHVSVHTFDQTSRLHKLISFYVEVVRALKRGIDAFYISRGGPYPILLLPFRILLHKPVYQFKNHPHISLAMRFYAHFCDTKLFTPTPSSFPMSSPKIHFVGGGQDTCLFRPSGHEPESDLITVGRIAPSKGLEKAINLIAESSEKNKHPYELNIYGAVYKNEQPYYESLIKLIDELGLSGRVKFKGTVKQDVLPAVLGQHRAFLSFTDTGLDGALLEAMACGVPILSTNLRLKEFLTEDLRLRLTLPIDDKQAQIDMLKRTLNMSASERIQLGKAERDLIVQNYSIESQFDRIVSQMKDSA